MGAELASGPNRLGSGRGLLLVLAIALLLRVGLALFVVASPERALTFDGREYLELGVSLAAGRGLAVERTLASGERIVVPEVFRTAGYPLFLAGLERLAPGHATALIVLTQAVLSALTCLVVYGTARELGVQPPASLLAALLLALDLPSAVLSAQILSETLATVLLALFLWLSLRFARTGRLPDLIAGFAALVASIHVRPTFAPIAPLIALGLVPFLWGQWRRLATALAVAVIIVLLGIGGWMARNGREAGYPTFSAVTDGALLFQASGLQAFTEGGDADLLIERRREELRTELGRDTKLLDQGRWYRAMRARGWSIVSEHAGALPKYLARQVIKLMAHPDFRSLGVVVAGDEGPAAATGGGFGATLAVLARERPLALAAVLFQLVILVLMWSGAFLSIGWLVQSRRSRTRLGQGLLLLGVVGFGLVASALPNAQARFRASLLPAILPLTAAGIETLTALFRSPSRASHRDRR